MAKIRNLMVGGAVGAALAYLFDPELGRSRRARLQDQLGASVRRGQRNLGRATRQLRDRTGAAAAQLEAASPSLEPEDDLTVLNRAESVLYGMPDFPKASVNLEVVGGELVLRGEVESEERAREIVEAASRVKGVAAVENLLHLPGQAAPNKAPSRRIRT